jgi:hypothetical protein
MVSISADGRSSVYLEQERPVVTGSAACYLGTSKIPRAEPVKLIEEERTMRKMVLVLTAALATAASLTAVAQGAAPKRARPAQRRSPFVPIDLAKMFRAGPLSNPQPPSTLLPAGATTVELTVRADRPTLCRYSVGQAQPLEQMTPFDAREPSSSPKTAIRGLDPDPSKVNDVYVRCAAAPEAVLHLQYRSLPAAKPGFPRTANLWGSWRFIPKGMGYASRYDLWLGAHFNADQIRQLRRLNPNCFILTSINTVENNDVPDEYFLRDTTGKKIEVWPGTYRLNLTRPEVAEYQARYAYQRMIESGLMYDGCFFDNFMMSQRWLTHDIYDRPVQLDADGDGKPDDKDQFDKAWREGVFRELREWRKLMPWALTTGHSQGYPYPEIAEIFNGQGIGFETTRAIEGKMPFHELWDYYQAWCTVTVKPAITSVESAVPNQIAYGYDYRPQRHSPPATWAFARDYYPYMRFGLALTLMNDGYFSHELGDTDHGQDWWYDELDFKLGEPLGTAKQILKAHGEEIFRRDFQNGIVLLNGTRHRQTVGVGEGYARLKGAQAPKHQYIVDDGVKKGFKASGAWREIAMGTKEWHAIPPYYHAWNNRCHVLHSGEGEATWDLELRGPGTYTIQAWWAAAPEAKQWTKQAVYELVAGGNVVASKALDQTQAGDQWHTIAERLKLAPNDKPFVRIKRADGGILVADALHVFSAERYNDDEAVRQVTLEPMDGIILRRSR